MRPKNNSGALLFQTLVFTLSLLLISGCAILQPGTEDTEEELRTRVEKLMEAKIAGDWGKVYSFYSPEYKKSISRDQFLGLQHSLDFLEYSITNIEKEASGKAATVNVDVKFSSHGFDFQSPDVQHWIKHDGVWYQKLEKRKEGMP